MKHVERYAGLFATLLVAGCIPEPVPLKPVAGDADGWKSELRLVDGGDLSEPALDGESERATSTDLSDTVGEAAPALDIAEITDSLDGVDAEIADVPGVADLMDVLGPDSDMAADTGVDVECTPACEGKECGDDDCGGSCGTCTGGKGCNASAQCVCPAGKTDCIGTCCEDGEQCHAKTGACCVVDCDGKQCGDDGCGNSCGECQNSQAQCVGGACVCLPDCTVKECGDDGCSGTCGECAPGLVCSQTRCAPFAEWGVTFESSGGFGSGVGVSTDAQGYSVVAGWYGWADTVLAGTTLHPGIVQDVMVAKVAPDGDPVWAKGFSGNNEDAALLVDLDGQGNIYVAGSSRSSNLDFGDGPLQHAGGETTDLFVVKLDSQGGLVWARAFGGTNEDHVRAMVVDSGGNVFLAGMFMSASLVLDEITLTNATGDIGLHDAFVAKLNTEGMALWATSLPASGAEDCGGIDIDKDGYIYVTGGFSSDDFVPKDNPLPHAGSFDIFVTALNSAGQVIWATAFGGGGDEIGSGLKVDSLGHVVGTALLFGPTIDFGDGPIQNSGGTEVIVFQLDKFGNHIWSHPYGGSKDDSPTSLVLDGADNIYVAGVSNTLTPDFGAGPLPTAGKQDIFVMKLDSSGATVWTETWGTGADEAVFGISFGGDGVFMTGEFWGPTFQLGEVALDNTTDPALLTDDGAPSFYLIRLGQ